MLAESTIRKQKRRLRRFIEKHISNEHPEVRKRVDQAYDMETALMWALGGCNWTPYQILGAIEATDKET